MTTLELGNDAARQAQSAGSARTTKNSPGRRIVSRIVQAIFVVWAAYTAAFFLLNALPGDPVLLILGPDAATLPQEEIDAFAAERGLDRPLIVQYFVALGGLLTGDLGVSYQMGQEVTTIIGEAIVPTLRLAAVAVVFSLIGGVALAFAASYWRVPWIRQPLLALPSLAYSIPSFWLGLVFIQIFAFELQILPAFSDGNFRSLILPALPLAVSTGAMIAQVFTLSLDEELASPYTTTARAKGAGRGRILFLHATRNAAGPVLTMAGLLLGNLVTGAVVTETVFSRAGFGRLIVTAVTNQDIPVVLGAVLVVSLAYSVINALVDLAYPLIDPRQRTARSVRTRQEGE
ncbi:ABC transporter permease [Corynebacterium auris]|uniref:ABC transporter permease n=1 Tax=Corynebacterium auris TaxID=44750 RepID=UPI0025B49050|nr:ABC transporter permease [Corynebacterium auris]WJY68549.1 Glutathione transport system permease protein GsiC [Corynebacterium auris]